MPVTNSDVADIFNKIADLLEIQDENPFRVRAYRQAARTIYDLSQNVSEMIDKGEDLSELPGIGDTLAEKIKIIVKTGSLPLLKDLGKKTPLELTKLMQIAGLGPKRVKTLYRELHIKNLDQLKKAIEKNKIRDLEGFGQKLQDQILDELGRKPAHKHRINIHRSEQIAQPLIKYLKNTKGVTRIEIVGSFRRRKETIGDIDILVTCKDNEKVMEKFVNYDDISKVVSHGDRRSTVLLRSDLQVDLRTFSENSYGAAMQYFTGSKDHNIKVRKLANEKGLKINEYGVYKRDKKIAGKTEQEVYASVDLNYIEPELRENRGEIEAAQQNKLPKLISINDIKGDLHIHSNRSDGKYSIEELARAAIDRGYEYIAITDHSKHVTIAHGLDAKQLGKEIEEIDKLNAKLKNIQILKGIEVDILEDGTLDLPDSILKKLDLVIGAVHYKFRLPKHKQTSRILKGMDNKYVNVLAHLTGRLINEREPYEIDIEKIIKEAKNHNCILEINAHPMRLDLNDVHCKLAKDIGVKLVISTDAHTINDFNFMRFGIDQARRGWVAKQDVINTYELNKLKKFLNRK